MVVFDTERVKAYSRKVFFTYLVITALVISYISIIFALNGKDGFKTIFQKGPISDVPMTIFYVSAAWLLFGSILVLLQKIELTKVNLIVYSAFFINAFLYLNILREKINYGDFWDYINAAVNLSLREPITQRYLYPPLWATLLQPLVPLGRDVMTVLLKAANYASLLLFFVLLYRICRRFGISKTVSALAVFIFTVVNTPILRTLGYVQVNIHVMNLILLSLLFSKKKIFLSALALSLAVHLKLTPVLLVFPFIWIKDWKWLRWFVLNMGGIVLFTSLMNGFHYYTSLYFLKNISTVMNSPGTIAYRDCSIDSFVRATFLNLQINLTLSKFVVLGLKAGLLFLMFFFLFRIVSRATFYRGEKREEVVHNSFVVLVVLMTVLSPIVWVHHLVFLIFPFLIILKKLERVEDLFLYISSYSVLFLLPTFNFYPFSYLRLLGVVLCCVLLYRLARSDREMSLPRESHLAK